MASKRVKKKRLKQAQLVQIDQLIKDATPFIDSADLFKISKSVKGSSSTIANRQEVISQLSAIGGYVSQQQAKIDQFRSRGAKIKYGKVKFHNALQNIEKYHLIKKYWDLVKQGHIKHESSLSFYEDIADWSLENMSDEELQEVIAKGEDRKAKISMRESSKMVEM